MSKSENQCQARTKSGKRCKRASTDGSAFCAQHAELLQECLWSHKGGLLGYVPNPPETLTKDGRGYWNQYLSVLLDNEKLMGVYLGDMHELCWRIDWRKDLEKELDNYGLINDYETGSQLIGIDKIIDRNDKRITDLKKQFGLTLDTAHKLQKSPKVRGEQKEESSKRPQGLRKVAKDF